MSELFNILKMFAPSSDSGTISSDSRRNIISRLKFIGTLQPHEKIDISNLKVETSSMFTPIRRLLTGNSRDSTLNFFTNTIDRSIEIVSATVHLNKPADKVFCANLIQDLVNSICGLRATQKTYATDKLFVCQVEFLIESIQGKLFEIQKDHSDLLIMKDACMMHIKDEKQNFSEPSSFSAEETSADKKMLENPSHKSKAPPKVHSSISEEQ